MEGMMKKSPGKTKSASTPSAQDRFLTQLIEERKRVAIFLISGVKLEGEIESYDQFVILIKGATTDQVYKHAVSTIQPLDGRAKSDFRGPREGAVRTTPIISRRKPRLIRSGE